MLLLVAFVGSTLAWEPVIKERHWFGLKEYSGEDGTKLHFTPTFNSTGELTYIKGYHEYHQGWWGNPHPGSSFNCWMDDSGDNPKPRFRMNNTSGWAIGMNNNQNYRGLGLKVTAEGTIINIQHLNNGDQIVLETYHDPINERSAFLMAGSIEGVTALNYNGDWPANGNTSCNMGNPDGVSNPYKYTGGNDGEVSIKFPQNMVIRCITIIYNNDNYKKATTRIDEIHDTQGNKGYEMTITGAGVLEDKRGAVPYLTMRYGDMNDMTFSRYLGTVNGEKQYGTSSIVDESDNLNPVSAVMQQQYRNLGEDGTRKVLVGKEWTVFTQDVNLPDQSQVAGEESPQFNSIYPLYGNYYYFFPEVDGKFHVKFYCEGVGEHMCMWYKLDGDGKPVTIANQSLSNLKASTDGGTTWQDCGTGGFNNTDGITYYEYTADFRKGDVYYLCSNPNNETQQSPIPRLISYSFIPEFSVTPLYDVVENGTTKFMGATTIKGVTLSEFTGMKSGNVLDMDATIEINGEDAPRIKCLGNVEKEGTVIKLRKDGNDVKLDFESIAFKEGDDVNQGGAIVVNLDCPAGKAAFVLTVAYKAADAKWNDDKSQRVPATDGGVEVKRWDFFSGNGEGADGGWDLGKYVRDDGTRYATNQSAWESKPKLFKEIWKADGLTADWLDTYVNLKDEKERIFKSVYDHEGDNADMIHETAGLLFHVESNLLGIFNENEASTSSFSDRYIGFMAPSDLPLKQGDEEHPRGFTIPLLTAGDRIVIKMGCYGNADDNIETQTATLKITGAKDAVGTDITGDYVIGGSGVETGNDTNNGVDITDKSKPWGEYHFIAKGGDFNLQVKEGDLVKIYSIVIYRNGNDNNASILTENEMATDNKTGILFTSETNENNSVAVEMRVKYRGLNESPTYAPTTVTRHTGNIQTGDVTVNSTTTNGIIWNTYTVTNPAKFGVFSGRMGVYSLVNEEEQEEDNKYVTDYVDCMIPVGYRETKTYPYTWDFTDLKKYVGAGIKTTSGDGEGNELTVTNTDLQIWNDYGLRVTPTQYDGNIFVSGGQLYGGTTMFDETRGIGITHDNNNMVMTMTGDGTDPSGGLAVNNGTIGFVIPQVKANDAIYVRAKVLEGTQSATYKVGNGTATSFTPIAVQKSSNESGDESGNESGDDSNEVIMAMVMANNATTSDVELNFQGYEVKKIAVSNQFKQLSDNGWATESRDMIIDPELTSYMTGVPFENLIVTSVDYTTKTVGYDVVNAVSAGELMPACTAEGGKQTYILHNTNNAAVEILNDGFHLFVPDMHDYFETENNGSTTVGGLKIVKDMSSVVMKAQLNEDIVARDANGYRNYVLSNTWRYMTEDGTQYGGTHTDVEAFYQVPKGGIPSGGHQGYLPVLIPESGNAPSFTFLFMGDDTTGIEETIATIGEENGENATYYNLNGQKISGVPTQRGIYIVNGKKIVKK